VIVADTNVVSELMRPAPSPLVVEWAHGVPAAELCTTAITVAEVCYGIERLPRGKRKQLLAATADEVFTAFADKVLPFDGDAARQYAPVVLRREQAGRPISGFDAQIAAICHAHHATLATRNTGDFEATGIDVVDPWRPPRRRRR